SMGPALLSPTLWRRSAFSLSSWEVSPREPLRSSVDLSESLAGARGRDGRLFFSFCSTGYGSSFTRPDLDFLLPSRVHRIHRVPRLALRCPGHRIPYWAGRFPDPSSDDVAVAIGSRMQPNGFLTKPDLLRLSAWKSPRSRRHVERNEEPFIRAATEA